MTEMAWGMEGAGAGRGVAVFYDKVCIIFILGRGRDGVSVKEENASGMGIF